MNRRNFVVGLGTVATISGVASVTAASFSDSVNPSTNFQIVPLEGNLVVRRLQDSVDYDTMAAGNDSWNETEINDFGNVTREGNVNNSVVAHLNSTENNELGAQLAFENRNETYEQYTENGNLDDGGYGFFEIANLGETDEEVGITFNYSGDNLGGSGQLTEDDVADMFTFQIDGTDISPQDGATAQPANSVTVSAGEIAVVGLEINITQTQVETIQDQAGASAFGGGLDQYSIQLLESIEVGVEFDNTA